VHHRDGVAGERSGCEHVDLGEGEARHSPSLPHPRQE
jgi:hypothetical protein